MKKLQLKVPANKNRLQINRAKQEIFQAGASRGDPFKQNLSNYDKLQQKEENASRVQLLPSVHAPPACLLAQPTDNKENELQTRKKISASLQAGKPKEARRSASIDLSKNSEKMENEQLGLSEAIKELIRLFQHRKLRKNNPHGVGPSSTDLQSALRFFITSKNISENSNINFSKNRLRQETNHDSIFRRSRKSSFAGDVNNNSKKVLKICSKNVHITCGGSEFGERRTAELREEFSRLKADKTGLERVVEGLKDRAQEQRRIIKDFQVQKQSLSEEIIKGSAQLLEMKRYIDENSDILTKMEARKFQIETFVHSQPNKIVRQASEYHKNLEIDLFEFADYLRHHPLGKKEFQPSIYYGQIERMMGVELQQMIKFLTQDNKQKCDQHCQQLLKFLEKLRHQYKLMNSELQKVIEQKTKYIEKYSKIMFLWYQNYLTKKEYLSNLREGFSLEVVKIEEAKKRVKEMEGSDICSSCANTKDEVLKITESVEKVVELFSLGNSFY